MKIAVTGGSGSVGRAVIELALTQGNSVVSIDRLVIDSMAAQSNIACIQADITDYAVLERAFQGCDALVHLAAIVAPGLSPDHVVHNNNVTGSYNALRAAAEAGIQRVCQASSVNATGLSYSRRPRFDYFPLDEDHPTYNEDPYGLSKWICEAQADSIVRRYETLTISSLRMHWVVTNRAQALGLIGNNPTKAAVKSLWAYTSFAAAARACLLSLTAKFTGHEVFYIVAPDSVSDTPSLELCKTYYPDVPVRGDLAGRKSFFNSGKAERVLGWKHEE